MAEPLEELNNSGKSSLETNEDTAIAGFSALLGAWCDSSSADEVLWIASEQPRTGNDVFGDSLTAHRLYFRVTEHFLDDEGKSDLTQFLNRFLDISSWPSDEVTQGGECVGDRGFYVPVDRLCEFFTKKEWPHTDLNSGALILGLTELSVEHASTVSQMSGKVILHQVSELSQECADMLAQGTANVSLPGLKSIPHTASHWTLVQRMAEFDDELMFLQLEEVNEELAQHLFELCKSHTGLSLGTPVLPDECLSILIRMQGYFGWGVAELSDSQAEILCKHNADLFLDEMTSLSDEAATLLSHFPYGLSITLDNLPDSAAQILRDAGKG
jgi:hypothetical protein